MKKICLFFLIFAMCLSLCACGDNKLTALAKETLEGNTFSASFKNSYGGSYNERTFTYSFSETGTATRAEKLHIYKIAETPHDTYKEDSVSFSSCSYKKTGSNEVTVTLSRTDGSSDTIIVTFENGEVDNVKCEHSGTFKEMRRTNRDTSKDAKVA